jgi:hypothetical protein
MSRCDQELADSTPIMLPDGTWAIWAARVQLPIRMGATQGELFADVSRALGSVSKAREAFERAASDGERWERLLASLPPDDARSLRRRVGEAQTPSRTIYGEREAAAQEAEQAAAAAIEADKLRQREERLERRRQQDKLRRARKAGEREARREVKQRAAEERAACAAARKAAREAQRIERAAARVAAQAERAAKRAAAAAAAGHSTATKIDDGMSRSLRHWRKVTAEKREQRQAARLKEGCRQVAMYLLFGTYSAAAALCGCTPDAVKASVRLADIEPIGKQTPLAIEVKRTMNNYGFDRKTIERALKRAKGTP